MLKYIVIIIVSLIPLFSFGQSSDIKLSNIEYSLEGNIGSSITVTGTITNNGTSTISKIPINFNITKSDGSSSQLDNTIATEQIMSSGKRNNFSLFINETVNPSESKSFTLSVPISNLSFKKGEDNIITIWPRMTNEDPTPEDNVKVFKVRINN